MDAVTEAIVLRTSGKVVVAEFTRGESKDEREILRLLEKLGEIAQKRGPVQLLLNMNPKAPWDHGAGIVI